MHFKKQPIENKMRVRATCHIAVCLLSLLMIFSTAEEKVSAQTDNPANPHASQKTPLISGHVYRADTRAPIAKATVTLYTVFASSNGSYATAETDSDGSYSFTDVRLNTYIPKASRDGFVAGDYSLDGTLDGKFLQLKPGVTFQSVDFYLQVAGVISGSISDDHGTPLKNIEVNVVRTQFLPGGSEKFIYVTGTRTAVNGDFHLKGLLPGSYFIVANGPHGNSVPGNNYSETYYPEAASVKNAKPVAVAAGSETKDIHLSVKTEKRYTITGKITGPGQPSNPLHYRYSVGIGRNASFSMKDDGSFTMPDVPAGDYTFTAFAVESTTLKNAGLGQAAVQITDADVQVNIEVGGAGQLSGRAVLPPSTQPLPKIRLLIRSDNASNVAYFDDNGHFDVNQVLPGRYAVDLIKADQSIYLKQVRCSGEDYTFRPISIAPQQIVSDCEVVIADDAGRIQGQVVADKPLPDLIAVLIPQAIDLRKYPRYILTAKVADGGRFAVANVIPGDYLLFVVPSSEEQPYFAIDFADRNLGVAKQIKVGSGETVAIDVKR